MSNDFKTFAGDPGANVLSQAQYDLLTTLRAQGFLSGTAESIQLNKVWRQSSIMAAVLGSLIESVTGQNAVDDGTTATLLSNLMAAMLKAGYAVDTGVVNAYVITLAPAPLAYYDGMVVAFKTANSNTVVAPTLNVNGLGAVTISKQNGSALIPGQLPANSIIYGIYNSSGPKIEVINSTAVSIATTSLGAMTTVASATNPDIFSDSTNSIINYTGTATCTGFAVAPRAGATRTLICEGACKFTAGLNLLIEGVSSGVTITLGPNAKVSVIALTTTQFKLNYTVSGTFTGYFSGSVGPGSMLVSYTVTDGRAKLYFPSPNNGTTVINDGTANFGMSNLPIQVQPYAVGYQSSPLMAAASGPGPTYGYAFIIFSSPSTLSFEWDHYTSGANLWSTTGYKWIHLSTFEYSVS